MKCPQCGIEIETPSEKEAKETVEAIIGFFMVLTIVAFGFGLGYLIFAH